MTDLLEYRTLEDLSRGWRITQPNLEQTGLLRVEYEGLSDLASDDARWIGLPAIPNASPDRRMAILRAILDHLRMQLAIDAEGVDRHFDASADTQRQPMVEGPMAARRA